MVVDTPEEEAVVVTGDAIELGIYNAVLPAWPHGWGETFDLEG